MMNKVRLAIISEEQMTEEQMRAYKFAVNCFDKGSFTILEVMQFLEEYEILTRECESN